MLKSKFLAASAIMGLSSINGLTLTSQEGLKKSVSLRSARELWLVKFDNTDKLETIWGWSSAFREGR